MKPLPGRHSKELFGGMRLEPGMRLELMLLQVNYLYIALLNVAYFHKGFYIPINCTILS